MVAQKQYPRGARYTSGDRAKVLNASLGQQRPDNSAGYVRGLYSRGDVSGLTNALKLITDVEVCKRLGTQARQRVRERYSFAPMLKRYENLLTEICLRRARGSKLSGSRVRADDLAVLVAGRKRH